ncbi:MAG: anaerobic glycerol-3-phosphate dehydrogenase subunit A [Chloroflexi bacterium]|nr:anaerobic glycerol-3-phosphate dehydrogenase subunit A [Chloroflexota bacterium]
MRQLDTEVLVIGGGATGAGVLRDLAMRGFEAVLVERRDLTYGTTGRFHGLLHSGGRYAVKDPGAARECIQENRILRRIMPHCIEDTGGFFVCTPWDDPGYADSFLEGCRVAGILVEEAPIGRMLAEEPLLDPQISRCFRVPDAAVDSFAAAHANVASAREYKADIFTYYEVIRLLTEGGGRRTAVSDRSSAVVGALCHDLVKDEQVAIHADLVVNAAGAWAGKIGASAGVEIAIRPGKGAMIAVSQRIVNTVINRCKMPSDGDILVPAHTVAVMGTTDVQVPDPDSFAIEPWEVQLLLEEGEKIIPGFKEMRMLRAWAGVRPLYQETRAEDSRDITRSFVLLDHQERDGVSGLITITSGKWTTYRKMAEATVDLVCEKLGVKRECRTHLEVLQAKDSRQRTVDCRRSSVDRGLPRYHLLGERLARIEKHEAYGQLICECELAAHADVERTITEGEAKTLDDIRRDVRLGMGPCQGGFCTLRAAGILHQLTVDSGLCTVEETNAALRDFLEERWKGILPVLWGKQLQQERLNELIYVNVLDVEHLPGPRASRLAAQPYALTPSPRPAGHPPSPLPELALSEAEGLGEGKGGGGGRGEGVVVIGAGLAGLTAAWRASQNGRRAKVIAKGWGATHWGSGCIDVLGYHPIGAREPVANPEEDVQRLIKENPEHPYALIGLEELHEALSAFQELCRESGYPLSGALDRNWLLPSAAGAVRPTCLAPETMFAGDLHSDEPMLIVGFEGYHDFFPHFAAANLKAQGFEARAVTIELPSLQSRRRVDTMTLGRSFDLEVFRAEVAEAVKPHLGDAARLGFPAVLGLKNPIGALRDLESRLGRRIFETPGLPPSVPGIRLHNLLVKAIQEAGGSVYNGMEVTGAITDDRNQPAVSRQPSAGGGRIEAVQTESASRFALHAAQEFILATGGFLGGGVKTYSNGYAQEMAFDLPLYSLTQSEQRFQATFLHPEGQPVFRFGARVEADLRAGYENLYIVGSALTGDFLRERSLEGVALVSGYAAGKNVGAK